MLEPNPRSQNLTTRKRRLRRGTIIRTAAPNGARLGTTQDVRIEDSLAVQDNLCCGKTRERKPDVQARANRWRRFLPALGARLDLAGRSHDLTERLVVAASARRPRPTSEPNLSSQMRSRAPQSHYALSLSAQRTRFQLRRPSAREVGVRCKPELGSAVVMRVQRLPARALRSAHGFDT